MTNFIAGLAQLVEQLICNHQVAGSSPIAGSSFKPLRIKHLQGFFAFIADFERSQKRTKQSQK